MDRLNPKRTPMSLTLDELNLLEDAVTFYRSQDLEGEYAAEDVSALESRIMAVRRIAESRESLDG